MDAVTSRTERTPGRNLQALAFIVALIIPFLAPLVSGVLTRDAFTSWYKKLKKPAWSPPGWIFGPVWTLLYLSMGIASWLVWKEGQSSNALERVLGDERKQATNKALQVYGLQWVLNAAWTPIFFGLRRLDLALAEIVVLWGAVLATVVSFYRIRPAAGWLLAPYQLWVTFAGLLNAAIWWRNR